MLPLSEGLILIESRKIVQGVYGRSEIVIADLTWFDVFDSEMLLDFDIVILPTAISEVELIATMSLLPAMSGFSSHIKVHPLLSFLAGFEVTKL